MFESNSDLTLLAPEGFEWDPAKGVRNLAKHGVDFDDAKEIFYGPVLIFESPRKDEARWLAVGAIGERIVSVVFTRRAGSIRLISARHPRRHEERAYRNAKMG
jgi:uncharacterized DUF497 family protein